MAPLARLAVAVGARFSRSWWKRLPAARKEHIKRTVSRKRYVLYGAAGLFSASGAGYYYTHLEETPITGRKRFMMYSLEEVKRILQQEAAWTSGAEEEEEEEKSPDILRVLLGDAVVLVPFDDPRYQLIHQYMTHILQCNAGNYPQLKEVNWRLIVVDSPLVNAISFPTGDIVVFTGMLKSCNNIHEFGFILSHEISHVLLNHGVEAMSQKGLVDFISLFLISAIWLFIPSDFFSFLLHKLFRDLTTLLVHTAYSRRMEFEADKVGLMLSSTACFDPNQSVKVWTHLPTLNQNDKVLEYLQTHPCNERRYQELEVLLPQAQQLYNDNCTKSTKLQPENSEESPKENSEESIKENPKESPKAKSNTPNTG